MVCSRKGNGGFDPRNAREREAGEFSEVVGFENVAGPKDAADALEGFAFGWRVGWRVGEQEQAFGGGGVDVVPGLERAAEEGKVYADQVNHDEERKKKRKEREREREREHTPQRTNSASP